MTIKTDFPYPIREIENTWIPLSDGTRLAARIWLPEDAETKPAPALLEYLPYRKNDGTALRDSRRQPYWAGHGYAAVRVDMRGSGDSDGILYDEYLRQEQDDALEVIAWLAEQPWCDGQVGMHGISWGGFNSLQVAARRPPQLKTIIAQAFTDDRYDEDVHYMGGCLLASHMLPWASVMFVYNAAPPDPRFVGDRWREMWFERLEKTPPFVETWLRHQRRDDYWRQGSVCEDYQAINIPVYAVCGWADSYNNPLPRLLANLSGPRKGLIGPWAHKFPEVGVPGPAIGFLQEALRWWDYWLKGIDTGIMDEPMLRCWIQESLPPAIFRPERPGRWVADPAWPSPHVSRQTYHLNSTGAAHTLDATAAIEVELTFQGLQTYNLDAAGEWGAYGAPGELPADQRLADGQALTFTSALLGASLDILGRPEVELTVAVDQPLALLGVRLCDVAPNGESRLVSWGLLNLTHRESHKQPTPLTPGQRYRVTVPLNATGYRIPAGHRWRVAISPTYWWHAWPSPKPVTLRLFTGAGSCLRLPVRAPQAGDTELRPFEPPEISAPLPVEVLRSGSKQQTVTRDQLTGLAELKVVTDDGRLRFQDGLEVDDTSVKIFALHEGEPLSAANRVQHRLEYRRGDWQVRIETDSHLTADETHFYVTNHLATYEGSVRVYAKSWDTKIPRDLV